MPFNESNSSASAHYSLLQIFSIISYGSAEVIRCFITISHLNITTIETTKSNPIFALKIAFIQQKYSFPMIEIATEAIKSMNPRERHSPLVTEREFVDGSMHLINWW